MAKRKNRTIIESAKAMMHDQNIHFLFWVEASNTTVYIQNRCLHSILENITPEEVFTGIKPDLSHLRIFGFPVYILVPKEKRTKLEPLGRKEYLLVIVKAPKESMFQDKDQLKSVEMLNLKMM